MSNLCFLIVILFSRWSSARILEQIKATFSAKKFETLRELFKISKDDERYFLRIDVSKFKTAVQSKSITNNERVLVLGYVLAINSKGIHEVEILLPHEVINKDSVSKINTYERNKSNHVNINTTGDEIVDKFWGGVNMPLMKNSKLIGSFTIITIPALKLLPYRNRETDKVELHHSLAGETLAHELIGHGLEGYDNSKGRGMVDTPLTSMQTSNLYLRIKEQNYYRFGTIRSHPILTSLNTKTTLNLYPNFLGIQAGKLGFLK